MHNRLIGLIGVCAIALGANLSWAAPYIIATNVRAECRVQPDGTITTVSVTLDPVTYSFYNTSLTYEFMPPSNTNPVVRTADPSTNPNPVPLFVPAGQYVLHIRLGSGPSSSPGYPVQVPALVTLAGRARCPVSVGLPRADGPAVALPRQ